ncbi:hypothetical protein [Rhizobium herbae]|uniref:Uncharacterized protein n=1 Tax=Rhizobium herbae TaxID=508661 RepID=A0ABS4EKT6_9HYPH|nr:hypothetical protein [Rhizobium herbae]MBP1858456.1 hypothetical protein [Rhizobium herbae]
MSETDRAEVISRQLEESGYGELYRDYINYLKLRAVGRRKEAMASANKFINAFANDPFEARFAIGLHLVRVTEPYWEHWPYGDSWLIPGNIAARLLVPIWQEFRERHPRDPEAWLYGFGLLGGLETAFLLDKKNVVYQYAHLNGLIGYLDYALHEFPSFGMVLEASKQFEETVKSIEFVVREMGENLTDLGKLTYETAAEFANKFNVFGKNSPDFRSHLVTIGRQDLIGFPIYEAQSWFKELPPLIRKLRQ